MRTKSTGLFPAGISPEACDVPPSLVLPESAFSANGMPEALPEEPSAPFPETLPVPLPEAFPDVLPALAAASVVESPTVLYVMRTFANSSSGRSFCQTTFAGLGSGAAVTAGATLTVPAFPPAPGSATVPAFPLTPGSATVPAFPPAPGSATVPAFSLIPIFPVLSPAASVLSVSDSSESVLSVSSPALSSALSGLLCPGSQISTATSPAGVSSLSAVLSVLLSGTSSTPLSRASAATVTQTAMPGVVRISMHDMARDNMKDRTLPAPVLQAVFFLLKELRSLIICHLVNRASREESRAYCPAAQLLSHEQFRNPPGASIFDMHLALTSKMSRTCTFLS